MNGRSLNDGPHPEAEQEPIDSLRSFGKSWDRFWFTPADPTTLGLMRICAGIVVLYVYFCYSFDLMSYVSLDEAWMDEPVVQYRLKEMRNLVETTDWPDLATNNPGSMELTSESGEPIRGQNGWSIFFHLRDHTWIWIAHIGVLVILFLFTIGWATRVISVLAFMGMLGYIWRSQTTLFGLDSMMIVVMFYMMVGPSGAALSLDRWLEVRRERKRLGKPNAVIPLEPSVIANITMRLMQIHFCFVYIAAGTCKLLGAAWWNGTALWNCYANYSFAPMRVYIYSEGLRFLCQHRWLWEIAMSGGVVFTLFTELSFTFLVWLKRWRWLVLSCSVLMHTGIGLTMGLVTFSLIMLCWVLVFVPPETITLFLASLAENTRWLRQTVYGPAATGKKEPALAG